MSNILLVPVHLDALVLDRDEMVVDSTADFTRLPYCTDKYDINPDIANISEEIVSTPFQNQNLLLKAGIHLHWSLPDALTRARYVPDGSGTQDFPRVPNRWLVTRCNAAGVFEKEWLVESDYLFPPANALASVGEGVAMPFNQGTGQPFRFMGRSYELPRQARDDRAAYYPKLTAVGYGEPTFAAYYPNCYSVFGFFDDEYSRKKDGRQYYLTGWYSDPDQDVLLTHVRDSLLLRANDLTNLKSLAVKLRGQTDPLTKYLNAQCSADTQRALNEYTGAANPPESLRKLLVEDLNRQLQAGPDLYQKERFVNVTLTPETRALVERRPQGPDAVHLNRLLLEEAFPEEIARRSSPLTSVLKDSFKWTIAPEGHEFPTRMLCYAKLVLGEAKSKLRNQRVNVAVGNTGTEALSACLATKLHGKKAIVEDHLEAMHLSAAFEHRQLDVGAKFSEARHEEGFTAVPGGTLWTVAAQSTADKAADATDTPAEITLPHELGSLLNVVNQRQAEYDRAWQQIESLRIQLFSDWYKYMLCVYPPEDTRDAYPDVDEVASYIANSVASLNQKIARAGTIVVNETGGRVVASVASGGKAGSLSTAAAGLAKTINNLQAFIDAGPDKAAYKLKQTSGPRYWRPTEPSILLEGSLAEPSKRHGHDAPGKKLLETQLLTGADSATDPADPKWRRKIRERIAEIGSSAGADKNFPFTTWDGQPWNPFLLEWEIEVFPVANKSNIDPLTGRYNEDFIVENYQLAEKDIDLSFKRDKGETTSAANLYSGRSILTPHARAQLVDQTEDYLEREVLPKYYQEANVSVSEDDRHYLTKNMEKIQQWYEARAKTALLSGAGPDGDRDWNLTAFRAWGAMKTPETLSQSLGGFNEALLMHKQTLQLHIADPLGFDDYQPFAEFIDKSVSNSIYSAPAPQNDFNPIRTGMMKIHRLRLIDTFGQIKDLDVSRILMSEPLDDGTDNPLVSLPPRLMQPARVNFRWLAADAYEEEMNDHPATTPICGWVLANNLDDSLMIYDNGGRALGSIVKKDAVSKLCAWAPAPGGLGIPSETEISNPHLKKMVTTILKWGYDFLDDFITAIDNALENIEPENFAHHQDLALLMGRPLALVRASVNLELKGLPATHQGWNEFRQDMQRDGRDDNGFTSVRFPIRIGEYRQFNDGTVGYWKEKGEEYEDDAFFAPQSDVEFNDIHLKTHKPDPEAMVFFQTVKSPPQILSLLIDPRGLVHATTGILPVKAINIPPDQYAAALQAIEITFLSTPVLTDAGKIHLPLPDEAGYQWSWLQQDFDHTWSEVSSRGLLRKETVVANFESDADTVWEELLDRGWIELLDLKDRTRAGVVAKDKRKNTSLDRVKDKTEKIEDLLDRAHIGPVDTTAKFSGQQEIREGWLKLSPAPRRAKEKLEALNSIEGEIMAAIVRASHPISFQLLNRDRHPILGIFDGQQGQTLKLEITNSSRRNMKPAKLAGPEATAVNHHFQLRFRPGTLVLTGRPAISVDEGEAGWRISKPIEIDGGVSFYLLITKPAAVVSGAAISVTLNNLSGDGKRGAHGTRVELKWKEGSLEYVASEAGQLPEPLVGGHRIQHLSVVNESGQKHIPLHVGIVGNNKVLNDGSVNTLKLRITNLLKPGQGNIQLNPKSSDPTKPPASEFIFSFDASASEDWALGTGSQVEAIGLSAKSFNQPRPEKLGQSIVWIMWPTEAISLKPDEFVEVNITNIKTNHPPGVTNLYIHYKNIPGYWDGDFVSRMEKAPLVYVTTRVGIGTTNPKEKLNVLGNVRIDNGEIVFGQLPSQIKGFDDSHRLIFGLADFELRERGTIVFSPGSDGTTKTARTVMLANGNVGIGTVDPAKHLHVRGAGDQEIMIESEDGGVKWSLQSSTEAGRFEIVNRTEPKNCFTILKEGNVGIGTTDPKAKLHVAGDARITGDARVAGHVRIAEDRELYFENKSRIRCFDNNHVIEFRRDFQPGTSTLELRERGQIMFSPGASQGVETAKVVMLANGNVGIGTTTPTKATLEVATSVSTEVQGYRYMNRTREANEPATSTRSYSIWASQRIAAEEFNAVSDERIKNIRGRSDGATDLCTLLDIEITDYGFRDVIGKGAGTYKKVVGQQVEKVFPQAVSRQTDVVPDIYRQAPIRDGWVALATDLKQGDRVKLIKESGKESTQEVLEVTEDKFRVDLEPEGEKVFVFGREVDDLLTVDYDAIAMLNVSATQQLKKEMDQEVKVLRAENAELRAANDGLAERLQLLETRLEAVLGVKSATNGVNGNGRH